MDAPADDAKDRVVLSLVLLDLHVEALERVRE